MQEFQKKGKELLKDIEDNISKISDISDKSYIIKRYALYMMAITLLVEDPKQVENFTNDKADLLLKELGDFNSGIQDLNMPNENMFYHSVPELPKSFNSGMPCYRKEYNKIVRPFSPSIKKNRQKQSRLINKKLVDFRGLKR